MSVTSLIPLLLLALLALLWLDGARARELATGLAEALCQRRGVQFLDGTVALARMGVRRTPRGLRIRRMFRFDFSAEGVGRRHGYVLLLGTDLETMDLDLEPEVPEPEEQVPPGGDAADDNKVVPFRRRH